jgi:C1A family cysteine protease
MKTNRKTNRKYRLYSGWKRDRFDPRDLTYRPRRKRAGTLVDLRPNDPPIYDQKALGSCTGNAVGGVFHFDELKQGLKDAFMPSRLFIYYNERVLDGTPVDEDAGSEIRTGIKTIAKQGVCSEALWPYIIKKFSVKPTDKCYSEALKHRAIKYMRVEQKLESLKACLAEGYPVVFGFNVFESFESDAVAKTGIVPMPAADEKNIGGHAVVLVGYDDEKKWFIVRNSWGVAWGDKGYFYMPYDYVTDNKLCDDFWTVRLVSAATAARAKRQAQSLIRKAA